MMSTYRQLFSTKETSWKIFIEVTITLIVIQKRFRIKRSTNHPVRIFELMKFIASLSCSAASSLKKQVAYL